MFQYLGSRGAQHKVLQDFPLAVSFNTWVREEPNNMTGNLSILFPCFNTWAREEPNFRRHHQGAQSRMGFSTWAREEPNQAMTSIRSRT